MNKHCKNIGFIGAGKMASAIINGILKSNFLKPSSIYVYDKSDEASSLAREKFGINIVSKYSELMEKCEIIFIATKPFVISDVMSEIKNFINNHLVISILAGVSLSKLESGLNSSRIIRVMPNTPALVGYGMSAICGNKGASGDDIKYVLQILSSLGEVVELDEKYFDIVTAISGSGPAFCYYFINEMAHAGEKLGLSYDISLKLALQTAIGSGYMIKNTGVDVETLIKNVTTPGGCTEVGNSVLKEAHLDKIIEKTIADTTLKAKKLGE